MSDKITDAAELQAELEMIADSLRKGADQLREIHQKLESRGESPDVADLIDCAEMRALDTRNFVLTARRHVEIEQKGEM